MVRIPMHHAPTTQTMMSSWPLVTTYAAVA
jgi:hypothetical protein